MGTLVEDIFAPSIDIVLKKTFDYDYIKIMPNMRKRKREEGREIEIDILVETTTKQVVIIEVKSNPNRQDNIDLFKKKLNDFLDFFPEYDGYEIIPIYAALNIHKSTIDSLTKHKIYAMVMRGDMLEVVNLKQVKRGDL